LWSNTAKITINRGRETVQVLDEDVTVKRFTLVILMALIALSMLICCAAPVPEPPSEFKVTSLAVTPIVVEPGQTVTINAVVKNTGQRESSCPLTLTVNGVEEEVKDVIVAPGATEILAFTLVRDASGMYEIEVDGLTETLRVKQAGAYPRLGNYYAGGNAFYWHPWLIESAQLSSLARWDLIVVHYDVARSAPESIGRIKELNPQAKILAWFPAGLCDYSQLHSVQSRNESWFLHYGDTPGNPKPPEERRVILWTSKTDDVEFAGMNPASEWSIYLPQFVHDNVMSTDLFDGVFYDCLWETMWLSNIDIDNDGITDSSAVVNREYQEGMAWLLQLTRELLGPEAIILGNPGVEWSANSPYFDYANGHMQENALGTESWSSHDFAKVWDIYQRNMQKAEPPSRIHWIAVDTNSVPYDPVNPDLLAADLQKMRYGLAIALLGDSYYGFDIGDGFHSELWWFPEYDANLGLAKGNAQKCSDGTWMREFENGVVVANPTSKESTIEFPAIHKDVTTGIEGLQFMVPPEDGRIFVISD